MSANHSELEKLLWASADSLRANSKLRSSEYSTPVLGLIFLRFADHKFALAQKELEQQKATSTSHRRVIGKLDYQAMGVLFLPDEARFSSLLNLPEDKDIGKAINDAMKAIEAENDELAGVLPKTYTRMEKDLLLALLKTFSGIPMDVEGDFFGKVYEYFLGKFAMSEGQRGGEFFTPTSLVKLIVEIIEPFQGMILDPACGSGGMFVQSARFVEEHRRDPSTDISIYGQEKAQETTRLCRMNLAVHGLSGDIKQANTFYENAHHCTGRFDFVMANPPFNVNGVDNDQREYNEIDWRSQIMNNLGWRYCELGDILTFQRGFDLPERDRIQGNIPIVSSSGINGYHNVAKVLSPGVVTGRYGTLGEVFYLEKDFWPLNTTLYIRDFKGNDPLFLSFFLKTLNLAAQNSAGAVPGLNRNALHKLPVYVPSLFTQRKIASILSVYDDLIKNNTRRIAILEEMAQSLYQEWFVHYRFPRHEKNNMVESELGLIPAGWDLKLIGNVIEILGGGTPSTKNSEYWSNGNITWFSPTDLTTASTMFVSDSAKKINMLGLQKSSARLFPAYSVMMTSRATIGVVAINTQPACTNQGFITCIPSAYISCYQLYFWLAENKEKITSLASGSTFREINKATFRGLPIVIPEQSVSQKFNAIVRPLCQQIENLIARNANLRQTRDLLLPKLISGEIDVEHFSTKSPEEAVVVDEEQLVAAAVNQ